MPSKRALRSEPCHCFRLGVLVASSPEFDGEIEWPCSPCLNGRYLVHDAEVRAETLHAVLVAAF